MNERDTILLHQYFNGLLSPDEAQQVRDRAASDPAFGQEFSLREEMEAFPRRAGKRKTFAETLGSVEKDFFRENSDAAAPPLMTAKVNWTRRVAAIAASLALLAAAYWFLNRSTMPEYSRYAQHEPLSLTVRGTADQTISAAEKAFAAKDYAGALTALDQILVQDPANITVLLYRGICLLELDRPSEARAVWDILATGQTALKSEAQWYIALSYLKEKNYQACKTALQGIEPGADRHTAAQALLKALKEP